MHETQNMFAEIESLNLAEFEFFVKQEIAWQNELAEIEKSKLVEIESLLRQEFEYQLKWNCYDKLQQLFKQQRFPYAIAVVESLTQRLPDDSEVRQWQARAYQSWGHRLIQEKQIRNARLYLKKALKTDPHNCELWSEVELDFRRIENLFGVRNSTL